MSDMCVVVVVGQGSWGPRSRGRARVPVSGDGLVPPAVEVVAGAAWHTGAMGPTAGCSLLRCGNEG